MEIEKKDLVKYYYKNFLEDGIYEKLKWYENYKSSYQYLIEVAENLFDSDMDLEKAINETDFSLEKNNSKLDKKIEDVNDFFNFFWKKRDNGVAGSQQHNFNEKVYEESEFTDWNEEILEAVAENKNIQEKHEKIKGKYEEIKEIFRNLKEDDDNEIDKMPNFAINRFFAVLLPGAVSTIGSEKKFNNLFKELDIGEADNWFAKNRNLMSELENNNLEKEILPSKFEGYYKLVRSIFPWYLWKIIDDPLDLKKEVVYYGIPGTGKTYQAKKKAEEKFRLWLLENDLDPKDYQFEDYYQLVQFHPSFDYEDFIEGIRPGKIKDGKAPLQLKNGIFKEFCQRAAKWEIDYYHLLDEVEELPQDFSEVKVSDLQEKHRKKLEGEYWGFLDEVENDTKENKKKVKDCIPPYFFVIDEINRAELSRVLGELMYCLEYRGYEGKVKTQYSYLVDSNNKDTQFYLEETETGKENFFFIPHNLYLIGTMNTIDRSIESFDFALRRRFTWEEKEPDADILEEYLRKNKAEFDESENIDEAVKSFEDLNKKISEMSLLGPEYRIGHTYLFELVDHLEQGKKFSEAREYIWEHNIKPLIEEYLRGIGRQGDLNGKLEDLKKKFLQKNES